MKLDVDQKIICKIADNLIQNILDAIDKDDWFVEDYRNSASGMNGVNSIPIFHSKDCADRSDALLTVKKGKLFGKYYPLVKPILNELKKYYYFNYHASFLARLNPRQTITSHVDIGDFLLKCNRIHVPLKTNPKVIYLINGEKYYWKRGFIYEFDNTLWHGVYNKSDEDRIHLILNLYNLSEKELKNLTIIEDY